MRLDKQIYFMEKALEMAEKGLSKGECPVGCIIVHKNKIISESHNLTNTENSPLSHAELICLKELISLKEIHKRKINFSEIEIYVTCEPCIMCAFYIQQLNVRKVFYGDKNERFGIHLLGIDMKYSQIDIQKRSVDLLKKFYAQINFNAPKEIRKTKNKK